MGTAGAPNFSPKPAVNGENAEIDDGGNFVKVTRSEIHRNIPGLPPVAVRRAHMIHWSLIFFLAFSLAIPTISAEVLHESNITLIKLRQDSDVQPEKLAVFTPITGRVLDIFIPIELAWIIMAVAENSVLRSFIVKMLICVTFAAQNTMVVPKIYEEELPNGEFDHAMLGFMIMFLIDIFTILFLFVLMDFSP